jgi:hypothetical protein
LFAFGTTFTREIVIPLAVTFVCQIEQIIHSVKIVEGTSCYNVQGRFGGACLQQDLQVPYTDFRCHFSLTQKPKQIWIGGSYQSSGCKSKTQNGETIKAHRSKVY